MTLRVLESFDWHSSAQWTRITPDVGNGNGINIDPSYSRRSGIGQGGYPVSGNGVVNWHFEPVTRWICGIAFNFVNGVIDGGRFLNWGKAFCEEHGYVYADSAGRIVLNTRQNNTGDYSLLISPRNLVRPRTWNYLEVKYTMTSSTALGDFAMILNGVDVSTLPGAYVAPLGTNALNTFVCMGSTSDYFSLSRNDNILIDDFYLCDGTGTVNNDFLGNVLIDTIRPTGNGTTNQYTGSDTFTVNNYSLINETIANDDTSYIEDGTPGNESIFQVSTVTQTPTVIHGIMVHSQMRKTDTGGFRNVTGIVNSGGTDYPLSTVALSDGYQVYSDIVETDPDTGTSWTNSGLANAQFGVKTL